MEIGSKIKLLRLQCELTQAELADRCELTKGYISQLENNLTSPSIVTLGNLLSALGSSLKNFFSDTDDNQIIFHKDDYFEKESDVQKTTWLVPNSQKNEMEPILVTILPKSKLTEDMPHEGEEFGYVLKGSIILNYDRAVYKVKEGETFYFVSDKVHYIENTSKTVAKILWVSSPPSF